MNGGALDGVRQEAEFDFQRYWRDLRAHRCSSNVGAFAGRLAPALAYQALLGSSQLALLLAAFFQCFPAVIRVAKASREIVGFFAHARHHVVYVAYSKIPMRALRVQIASRAWFFPLRPRQPLQIFCVGDRCVWQLYPVVSP